MSGAGGTVGRATRIVGPRAAEPEIECDPVQAWRRAVALDAQLGPLLPPHPRGVWRGTFEFFAQMDAERALAIARRARGE